MSIANNEAVFAEMAATIERLREELKDRTNRLGLLQLLLRPDGDPGFENMKDGDRMPVSLAVVCRSLEAAFNGTEGAENYLSFGWEGAIGGKFQVTIQKDGAKTPAEVAAGEKAEVRRLRNALKRIGKQSLSGELSDDQASDADFVGGYDAIIAVAREALAALPEREVCAWSSDFIDKDCGGDSSWCIDGDPPNFCPDCGLPVAVTP